MIIHLCLRAPKLMGHYIILNWVRRHVEIRGVVDPVFSGSGSVCLPALWDLEPASVPGVGTTSKLQIGSM